MSSDEESNPIRNSDSEACQWWPIRSKLGSLPGDQTLTKTKANPEKEDGDTVASLGKLLSKTSIRTSSKRFVTSVEEHPSELEKKVIAQMEHYFGDFNLPRDRFMNNEIKKHDGWMPMSVMMKFPKLVSLSKDPHFIMRATMKSKKGIVEVDYENERVRRSPRDLCPSFLSNERKSSMNARTLRVRGFPKTTTLDELLNFFECEVEDVTDVRRYWDGKNQNDKDSWVLGSAFVTFGTRESAEDFLCQEVEFQGQRLISEWCQDDCVETAQYNDTFDEEYIHKTVWVNGFGNQLINPDDLAEFFTQFKGAETFKRRKMRQNQEGNWKFLGSVFVTFEDRESAEAFLALPNLSYNGKILRAKFQLDFYKDHKIFLRKSEKYLRCTDRNNN